jgi:hypothetical protein
MRHAQITIPLKKQIGSHTEYREGEHRVQQIAAKTLASFFQQGGSEDFFTIKAKLVHLQYI